MPSKLPFVHFSLLQERLVTGIICTIEQRVQRTTAAKKRRITVGAISIARPAVSSQI
jgi:hypothetical protein